MEERLRLLKEWGLKLLDPQTASEALGSIDPALYWSAVGLLTLLIVLLLLRSATSRSRYDAAGFSGSNERIQRLETLIHDLRSKNSESISKMQGEILYLKQEIETLKEGKGSSEAG